MMDDPDSIKNTMAGLQNSESLAWILLVISVCVACGVSMLCSLLEAALLSLTPSQAASISKKNPKKGRLCHELKHDIAKPIAVILILNTAAHTIGAAVAGAAFNTIFGQSWLWVFTLALTVIMVQYTEILPKTLGVKFNIQIISFSVRILKALTIVLSPVITFIHMLNRPFEKRKNNEEPTTAEEISALAAVARSSQEINSQQERIIKAVPQLSEQLVKEVMLPLDNVSFIPHDQSVAEAITFSTNDFHTRYPICERGNYNKVYGYVNFKELVSAFRTNPNSVKLEEFIRPILFVSAMDSLDDVLKKFSSQYCHMAIVKNDNDEVIGMLTLEDIIEELIGDLNDEFDPLPRTFYSPTDGFYVVGGGNPVSLLAKEAQFNLPKKREPLAIWFSEVYTQKLRVGIVFRYNNAEFYVRKIRRGRVLEFNVKRVIDK